MKLSAPSPGGPCWPSIAAVGVRDGAAADHQDRERARGRDARGEPRGVRARRARLPLPRGGALARGGRRAAARAAVRSRRGRGARRAGGAVHPARSARRRGRRDRALAGHRADGAGLPRPGAPRRGAHRRDRGNRPPTRLRRCSEAARLALADEDPEADRDDSPRAGRRAARHARSAGGAGDGPAPGAGGARDAARARAAGGAGLDDGRARRGEERRSPPRSTTSRPTSRRASSWPSCRWRAVTTRRPRRASSTRSTAPIRRWRSPAPSPAGWSCAARWPRRRSWRTASTPTCPTPTRSSRRPRSSARSSAPSARWRFAERARKLGASAGRVAIMIGAALAAKDDQAGALKSYRGVRQERSALLRGLPARRRAAARQGEARRGRQGAR